MRRIRYDDPENRKQLVVRPQAPDLHSVPRDSCKMRVIGRIPSVHSQATRKLAHLLHCLLVTRGNYVSLGWEDADLVTVSTSCTPGHQHIA
jgi:hypothetical protein